MNSKSNLETGGGVTILGLDPGTATTGWGVIRKTRKETKLVAYGCIETCKTKCAPDRLKEIGDDLLSLIKSYKPDEAAVEDLFFFKNLKTAIKVAQARGVLLLICRQQKIPVYEYTPLQIKQGLTGYGRADKNQVQQMVKQIFKLKSIPKPDDAADAIAVAVCHEQSRGQMLSTTKS
jgi:crossover junction endodeoxyribonuclease RuvC